MEIISTSDVLLQEYGAFLLGNNLALAKAEVESLTNSIAKDAILNWHGRFGTVKCKQNPIEFLKNRAVLTHEVGNVLLDGSDIEDIVQNLHKPLFRPDMKNVSFAVRVCEIDSKLQSGEKAAIASKLGKYVCNLTDWSVSLKNPQKVFTVFVGQEKSFLCESYSTSLFKQLLDVHPKQYPFFHPSMMNSILARVMCNIAGVMPSHVVLDPFCGGGGLLLEAVKIGAKVVGVDRNWRLLTGAQSNLNSLKGMNYTLIQGDARKLAISDMDHIVTDPPYGKSSSTLGTENTELVETFVKNLMDWKKSCSMCICSDSKMNLEHLFHDLNLEVKVCVPIPVHRSLIREIFLICF